MSLVLLLEELANHRIELRVEDGRLHYKAPEGALTTGLRERLAAQREALIRHLTGQTPVEPEIQYSPVSAAQERLWFIHQMQGPNFTYNIPLALRLRGRMDRDALRTALDDVVRRHQSLRCSFQHCGESPRLEIQRDLRAPWDEEELAGPDDEARWSRLSERVKSIACHCFELSKAPLMRTLLLRLGPEEHVLVLNCHHIIADGWSINLLVREIAAGYEARLKGQAPTLPPLPWQYTDYIAWQQQLRVNGMMETDLAFWRQQLTQAPFCTTMAPDHCRPPVQSFSGASVPLNLDAAVTARLRMKAREWEASLNHLTLAATIALLAEYSGSRDLVIGLPVANRTRRELESIIGMFVNVLPLRISVPRTTRWRELVATVKQSSTAAMEHANLPFEQLVKQIGDRRDLSMNPVYQAAYTFLPPMEKQFAFGGFHGEVLDSLAPAGSISKNDCTFYFEDSGGAIAGQIEYATSLYRPATVERWAHSFLALIESMLEESPASAAAIPNSTKAEQDEIAAWCSGRPLPLPEASPWTRIECAAMANPYATALEDRERRISYAELVRMAGIVSAKLAKQGVGKGDRVGLILPRGCELVAAMLGVVHRGAVFVPFDRGQPAERLAAMMSLARLRAICCPRDDSWPKVSSTARIHVDTGLWCESESPPSPVEAGLEDPLYMIFTSGSTGVPKAVVIPWRGLCNFAQSFIRDFDLHPGERLSQSVSPSFDGSLFEIWPALLGGGTLVFVPEETKLDPAALRDWLLRERINLSTMLTPLAEELMDLEWPKESPLRVLMTGGQTLHKYPRPDLPFRLSNNYGPTEITVACTWGVVPPRSEDAGLPTIGRPIHNVRIAILNPAGRSAPLGAVGELHISGPGVALGYFENPEATARSFVTLPNEESTIWYRSGDLVRMRPNGELEFVGRADNQVKLRGYRIEIGEIESALLHITGLRQAAVRLEGEHLVAYVEVEAAGLSPEAIRQRLADRLPQYMVPAYIVVLPKLPRQSSGKIDLQAITAYQPPTESADGLFLSSNTSENGVESALARVWSKVLNHPVRGVNDNFFDLGGHSLMLVRLRDQIQREMGRKITILDLFRNPTIARQAAFLQGTAESSRLLRPAMRSRSSVDDIAIIGMAGRFPEADNIEDFWRNLCAGRECIRTFRRDELLDAGMPPELVDDPDYVPVNAILKDIDRFDAEFFGLSAREAEIMDPQQRLLLEEAWHAFENAGYDLARIKERVGVFVGSSFNSYLIENVLPRRDLVDKLGSFAVLINNDKDFAATRISYKLDLRGPSMSVNTACSTSLVAIHQAVTALHDGQCELALAGGACVRARQIEGYRYENGGILSRDGHCRAFDRDASGMVGGNGVALVVLKPLSAALADGDPLLAVIKGIAVNNDGADKVGFTAPSIRGQTSAIRDAIERAGVDPQTVLYVETHGTGTQLGDSIEIAALAEVYARNHHRDVPLRLGSVKTNVGHLDSAAGVAGLIKTAMCLCRRMLVPSLHFRTPNPQIPWPGDLFKVCTETAPFGDGNRRLRAAVSSLGIGGTNAHAILEEAPPRPPISDSDPSEPVLLLVSGRNANALRANAMNLGNWFAQNANVSLRDAAHTLAFGRRHWECRYAFSAASPAEATERLLDSPPPIEAAAGVAFMFTGMGTQQPGMARGLYERASSFKAALDECASLLHPILNLDIRDPLLAAPDSDAANALFDQQHISQPSVFALEYALARFWMDLGISPTVLIGHSLGEWIAAALTGVFSLSDALRLVSVRGRLMEEQPPGAMLAVNLTEAETAARLPVGVEIAAVNALDQIIVAGPISTVQTFAAHLEEEGIRHKQLRASVAAHSSLMEPALDRFRAEIDATPRQAPKPGLAVVSNVTGTFMETGQLTSPDYWTTHLRHCVRFVDGMAALWARPGLALLECGPSPTLCNIAMRDVRRPAGRVVAASSEGENNPRMDWRRILMSAGYLWAAGLALDLDKLFSLQRKGRRIALPGYAFQRKRCWLDAVSATPVATAPTNAAEASHDTPCVSGDASLNSAEELVIAIMRELLGPVHLSRQSDFFLSGGDSLLAVRLASHLGKAFSLDLAPNQIMQARTPAKIAMLLQDREVDKKAEKRGDPCLVRLANGNSNLAPIVLIHAVGGGAFIYRELVQALATPHPVYGLQAPGLWDNTVPIAGLRQQAEYYFNSLRQAGIEYPVMIGGSSYGGLVAYELDRLFQRANHHTSLVVLFDSPGPGQMPQRLESEADICAYLIARDFSGRDFAADQARMQALDHDGRFAVLLDSLRQTLPHITLEDIERLVRVFRQNLINMWDWVPEPHDAHLLFFKAKDQAALLARDPELAWIPLACAGIEILPCRGDHSSILSFPQVKFVANEINLRLSRAPGLRPDGNQPTSSYV